LLVPACLLADEPTPRTHWAFQPPVRPVVPVIRNPHSTICNPIDAFLAARHEKLGLTPAAPADKGTLLRRVTLDLTGLPPTRPETSTCSGRAATWAVISTSSTATSGCK